MLSFVMIFDISDGANGDFLGVVEDARCVNTFVDDGYLGRACNINITDGILLCEDFDIAIVVDEDVTDGVAIKYNVYVGISTDDDALLL